MPARGAVAPKAADGGLGHASRAAPSARSTVELALAGRSIPARIRASARPLPNLSHGGIEPAIGDVPALGNVGLERGDVIRPADRRREQRLLAGIELDGRGEVVADRPLERRTGAQLPALHLATASIRFSTACYPAVCGVRSSRSAPSPQARDTAWAMSQEKVKLGTVKCLYNEYWAPGVLDRVDEVLHPAIVWTAIESAPDAGTRRGYDGCRAYMKDWLDDFALEPPEIHEVGSTPTGDVVCSFAGFATGRAGGVRTSDSCTMTPRS